MTFRQEHTLQNVRENIQQIRLLLDDVMYHMEPLDDQEYEKVRSCYNHICEANDAI